MPSTMQTWNRQTFLFLPRYRSDPALSSFPRFEAKKLRPVGGERGPALITEPADAFQSAVRRLFLM
jgi:hypothetical protein